MRGFHYLLCCVLCGVTQAFLVHSPSRSISWLRSAPKDGEASKPQPFSDNKQDNKFGFFQRIESVKCLIVGAVSGSIALAPFALLHDLWLVPSMVDSSGLAQFEFDTDAAAVQSGLFAIVYRYCIRTDTNPQLQDGVVGAFAITRTLSRIVLPSSCSAIPLYCGPPLGYLDWGVLGQLAVNGVESMAMFMATSSAISYCMERRIISKFE
ncbi:hypothetical protein FisN_23Lh152 [Fistulifera solaris]|uniref:Uncharacterized protein n=1 Tax=Fistulifera solaris TaxID=1519565 RepID=A0A1Z5K4V4_FISSO|nr:hypothetical protein FisN_23Lh152 [Fistulifera solaris]|eukprot:GAX21212.1 hypothetical protein FisN_23Lh152 [Fistulifera solaris]